VNSLISVLLQHPGPGIIVANTIDKIYVSARPRSPDGLVRSFTTKCLQKDGIGDCLAHARESWHLHDEVDIGAPDDDDVLVHDAFFPC
jgi:hypothetical protein